jgi:hypothetical protein
MANDICAKSKVKVQSRSVQVDDVDIFGLTTAQADCVFKAVCDLGKEHWIAVIFAVTPA